jgi:hypothetical protein
MEVPPTRLFELLARGELVEIIEECVNIEQARHITFIQRLPGSLTPLHLADMAKDAENNGAREAAIRSLLHSDLHGAKV